jgi:hypothetical protein
MDLKCIFHNRCIYRVPILVVLFSISSRNNRVKINRKKLKPFHYFSNKNNVHQIRKKRQYLVTKYSNRRLSAQTSTHTARLEVVSWRSGGQSVDRENIKKLHQIQKQSQQLVTKYLTKRCERKETASQVGSLGSGRQAKCQYSESTTTTGRGNEHLEQIHRCLLPTRICTRQILNPILLQHLRLAADYLFLFPAEPPAAFPADPEAFDFAGAFFALDPLPLVFRSSCTWIPMGVGSKLQIS